MFCCLYLGGTVSFVWVNWEKIECFTHSPSKYGVAMLCNNSLLVSLKSKSQVQRLIVECVTRGIAGHLLSDPLMLRSLELLSVNCNDQLCKQCVTLSFGLWSPHFFPLQSAGQSTWSTNTLHQLFSLAAWIRAPLQLPGVKQQFSTLKWSLCTLSCFLCVETVHGKHF